MVKPFCICDMSHDDEVHFVPEVLFDVKDQSELGILPSFFLLELGASRVEGESI